MAGKPEKANIFLHENTYDELMVLGKIQHKNKSELMREAIELLLENYRKAINFEKFGDIMLKSIIPIIEELKELGYNREAISFKERASEELNYLKKEIEFL